MAKRKKILSEEEFRELLQEACDKAGSQAAFAETIANVSPQYVSDVLKGRRQGEGISNALGYRKRTVYERLDAWEEKSEDTWEKDGK